MTPRATTGAFSQAGERATDDEHHDPSPHRRRASTAGTGSSSLAAFAQRIALPGCVIVPASRTSSPTRPFAAASNASSASPPPRSKPSSKKNAVQPWSREDVMTLPNYISMARGAFGPVLGAAYVADAVVPEAMLAGVAVAGLSDWLDGYAARRMRLTSVAGTYLDPLGDKIFVASVAVALAAKGGIPLWLATSMVARDVALISGAWIQRGRALGWRWDSWGQFFAGTRGARFEDAATLGGVDFKKKNRPAPAVPPMRPDVLGKLTTATQFALFGSAIAHGSFGVPSAEAMQFVYLAAGAATFASGASYFFRRDAFRRDAARGDERRTT